MQTNPIVTAGEHIPFRIESTKPISYEPLQQTIITNILVIWWGIAWLTSAYFLTKLWLKVVVVDDWNIGSWESGRTTAHLSYALDSRYYELMDTFGESATNLIARSHKHAIDLIEEIIHENDIHCDFKRVDWYLFLHPTDKIENLMKEFDTLQSLWMPVEWVTEMPGIEWASWPAIRFPNQWQFHIEKYLRGLAKAVVAQWWEIYTESKADHITSEWATVNGHEVHAKHIIVATNSPINDRIKIHSKMWSYRTYVIAWLVEKDSLPFNQRWDTWDQESPSYPYHYTRLESYDDDHDLLIIWWEDHKTWQADQEWASEENRYINLIRRAQKHFPMMKDIKYRWSGQVVEPFDWIAYIWKNPLDSNIYIITGDSGNGMTHGTIAWPLLTDIIEWKDNLLIDVYSPSRFPVEATKSYLEEVANIAKQYGKWFTPWDIDNISKLKPWEWAIMREWMEKMAVYRDDLNKLHVYNAVCPHLWAILEWNKDEKSFDCPCHGSRFSKEWIVINWPAIVDIEEIAYEDIEY